VEDIPRGGRLKAFSRRWFPLDADLLVKRGVMQIYMDRIQAENYWTKNIQFKSNQQEGRKSNEPKNPRCDKEKKMVQLI
jgi:hypothetical protein